MRENVRLIAIPGCLSLGNEKGRGTFGNDDQVYSQDRFRETLGVEVVYAHQLGAIEKSRELRGNLWKLLENLPDELLEEVKIFAEFLELEYKYQSHESHRVTVRSERS